MRTLLTSGLGLRTVTVLVWALAAGSIGYWGLRLVAGPGTAILLPVQTIAPAAIDSQAVARLLGASSRTTSPQVSTVSRFSLQGVVAGSPAGDAALIAVDGKPARPILVGSAVEEGLILQSAQARQAILAATREGPALFTLDLPPLKR